MPTPQTSKHPPHAALPSSRCNIRRREHLCAYVANVRSDDGFGSVTRSEAAAVPISHSAVPEVIPGRRLRARTVAHGAAGGRRGRLSAKLRSMKPRGFRRFWATVCQPMAQLCPKLFPNHVLTYPDSWVRAGAPTSVVGVRYNPVSNIYPFW